MLHLFNESMLDMSGADGETCNSLEAKHKDELATFLAKVAHVTRETRSNNTSSLDVTNPADLGRGSLDATGWPGGRQAWDKLLMTGSPAREREFQSPSRSSAARGRDSAELPLHDHSERASSHAEMPGPLARRNTLSIGALRRQPEEEQLSGVEDPAGPAPPLARKGTAYDPLARRKAVNAGAARGKSFYAGPNPAQLVPSATMYHRIPCISFFMESSADEYAREYGAHFQALLKQFEKNLDNLKKEIQMAELEKRTSLGEAVNAGMKAAAKEADGGQTDRSGRSRRSLDASRATAGTKKLDVSGAKAEGTRLIEGIKFPSMGKLHKMGVTYRPSIRHKIASSGHNILKDPALETVRAQVDSNRHGQKRPGASPPSEDAPAKKQRRSPYSRSPGSRANVSLQGRASHGSPGGRAAPRRSPKERSASFLSPSHGRIKQALASRKRGLSGTGESSSTVSECTSEGLGPGGDEEAGGRAQRAGVDRLSQPKRRGAGATKGPSRPAKLKLTKSERRDRQQARSRRDILREMAKGGLQTSPLPAGTDTVGAEAAAASNPERLKGDCSGLEEGTPGQTEAGPRVPGLSQAALAGSASEASLPRVKIKSARLHSARQQRVKLKSAFDFGGPTRGSLPQGGRGTKHPAGPQYRLQNPLDEMERHQDESFRRLKQRHWRAPSHGCLSPKASQGACRLRRGTRGGSVASAQLQQFLEERPQGRAGGPSAGLPASPTASAHAHGPAWDPPGRLDSPSSAHTGHPPGSSTEARHQCTEPGLGEPSQPTASGDGIRHRLAQGGATRGKRILSAGRGVPHSLQADPIQGEEAASRDAQARSGCQVLAQRDLRSSYSQAIGAIQQNFDIMNRFVQAREASHRELM